jgi:hypothetical protein
MYKNLLFYRSQHTTIEESDDDDRMDDLAGDGTASDSDTW